VQTGVVGEGSILDADDPLLLLQRADL